MLLGRQSTRPRPGRAWRFGSGGIRASRRSPTPPEGWTSTTPSVGWEWRGPGEAARQGVRCALRAWQATPNWLLTHRVLLQWVWGPERVGESWPVRGVVKRPAESWAAARTFLLHLQRAQRGQPDGRRRDVEDGARVRWKSPPAPRSGPSSNRGRDWPRPTPPA